MTEISDDFFGEPLPDGPPRDRYGRPTLVKAPHEVGLCSACADGDDENHRQPYTRASSLADYLADFAHIWKWKFRYLARAMGQNRDLAMLAGAESYTTGFDKGDLKENRASGQRLDSIIERALDRGGINERADYGTVIHALTEPGNDGFVEGKQVVDDVRSFNDKVNELGIIILGTEIFTANDDLMAAGTFDHLMWVPGYGIVITDKKTSSDVHGEDFRIQLTVYANADVYDWETDERTSLEDYVAARGWDPSLINRDQGLIFWIKDGVTQVVELDLAAGLEAAHHAAWVRDNHRKGKHSWPAEAKISKALAAQRSDLLNRINLATTVDELEGLWTPMNKVIWTLDHTVAAVARKEHL